MKIPKFIRRRPFDRRLLAPMIVVLAAAVCGLALFLRQPKAIETGAWGLSFQKEGQPPAGTASQETLDAYGAAYRGNTDEKVLYLTFDLGYEAGYTATILDVLKAHDAPAAFFVVGSYLESQPELVRRMAKEGHIVGNHTWHHYDMSRISDPAVFREELERVAEQYRAVTGEAMPPYYRPPQGIYSEDNLAQAQALGYHTVFWSLAYVDWKQDAQPAKSEAYDKLIPRMHPGCILLLHATSKTNAEILDDLLTRYEQEGYRFGTLDELFAAKTGAA